MSVTDIEEVTAVEGFLLMIIIVLVFGYMLGGP